MSASVRPRLAIYWGGGCGGCEVALLNLGDSLPMLDKMFEIAFCPCLIDVKRRDVDQLPDGHIDLCLFDGAIRTSDDAEMARLLRSKSRYLTAFGSCAQHGCIPSLANLSTTTVLLDTVFTDGPSLDDSAGTLPQPTTAVAGGELHLPQLAEWVVPLEQVTEVDYSIPGCPPEPARLWEALELFAAAFMGGRELPPRGAVVGVGAASVCEECPREREETPITSFARSYQKVPAPERCLLDQGLLCLGVATRGGCGALCPQVAMGCRGCYGPPDGVVDHGARQLAAVASALAAGKPHGEHDDLEAEVAAAVGSVADPAGTFYRFSLGAALLPRARPGQAREEAE